MNTLKHEDKAKLWISVLLLSILLISCDKNNSGFTSFVPQPSFETFVDSRDNHVYTSVKIGNQIWMAENLSYLPSVSPSSCGSNSIPYYYVYDYQGNDINEAKASSNYMTYGVLYNWPSVMAGEESSHSVPSWINGICPDGWHLPSDEEWKILEGEVDSKYDYPDPIWDSDGDRGTDAGDHLKETGTIHWSSQNTGILNNSGFTGIPGGARVKDGLFSGLGKSADFWSSSSNESHYSWNRSLLDELPFVYRGKIDQEIGLSVRCIKDH